MSKNNFFVQDEREEINSGVASQWAFGFVILFVIGKFVYIEFFSDVTNTEFLLWDVLMLIIASIIYVVVLHRRKSYALPKSFLGSKLLTEQTKEGKKQRIIKSYLPEAIIFALGYTVGSHIFSSYPHVLNWVIDFVIAFIISHLISYAWGEYAVKRYNESLED